jgi:lipoprotein-releasing system permease protein
MSIAWRIARRYLLARSLPTAVNALTLISVGGIALAGASLVLVLSVFNGFQQLIGQVFAQFDPELRIEAATGRYLPNAQGIRQVLKRDRNASTVVGVLEGRAILQYRERQAIVRLKGVEPAFTRAIATEQIIYTGRFTLADSAGVPSIVVGAGVAQQAMLTINDRSEAVQLFSLSEQADLLSNPTEALRSVPVVAMGAFTVQKEYDDQLVVASLPVARQLFGCDSCVTAFEVSFEDAEAAVAAQARWRRELGSSVKVLSANELHPTLYQIFKTEKLAGYVLLTLILILTATTISGTLSLIVIDKRLDLAVLRTMGASPAQLGGFVLVLGSSIGVVAVVLGLCFAGLLGWSQIEFGWLKISGGESFLIDAFPVQLQWVDFAVVAATVLALAVIASAPAALRVAREPIVNGLRG